MFEKMNLDSIKESAEGLLTIFGMSFDTIKEHAEKSRIDLMLESEDKLKMYQDNVNEWRMAFGGMISQQVVEDLIFVAPFSKPDLAKKEDEIVDSLSEEERTKWFRREIMFYRRELAGIKYMYDQERAMRMQMSQGGQPGVQRGYPRQIPPNMTAEQLA